MANPPAAPPPPSPPAAAEGHEYAPLREVKVTLPELRLRRLDSEEELQLSRFARGKRLVVLAFFAPWCPNWGYQAPGLAALQRRYEKQGLAVLAVSEYASLNDTRAFFREGPPPYPVVVESLSRDDRERTQHFRLRQATGDTRKWGSPFLLFFAPGSGRDPLRGAAWAVNGELIEHEVAAFLGQRLGEPATRRRSAR